MSSHVKSQASAVLRAVTHRFVAQDASLAAHVRLATALRETIDAGDLHPGDPLPGDAALIAVTGLARGTVRQAVSTLRAEGRVQTRQGARSTVLARPRLQPFSELLSFSAWARTIDAVPSARVVELARGTAGDAAAIALHLPTAAQVWSLLRVRLLDGEPTLVERANYPEAIGALLVAADLSSGSVYAALAEQGIVVASGHHRISAIGADRQTALLLNVKPGTPLLRQERTVYASDGTPIEHSDDLWRGDAIVLDAANSVHGSQLARRSPDTV